MRLESNKISGVLCRILGFEKAPLQHGCRDVLARHIQWEGADALRQATKRARNSIFGLRTISGLF